MDLYVVARYTPTPNVLGRFGENVLPINTGTVSTGWQASGMGGWFGSANSD